MGRKTSHNCVVIYRKQWTCYKIDENGNRLSSDPIIERLQMINDGRRDHCKSLRLHHCNAHRTQRPNAINGSYLWRIWTTHEECSVISVDGWNRCSSFDSMPVLTFCEFGLKMPVESANHNNSDLIVFYMLQPLDNQTWNKVLTRWNNVNLKTVS